MTSPQVCWPKEKLGGFSMLSPAFVVAFDSLPAPLAL